MCTKVQLDRSMCLQVMAENAKCAKWRRKKMKKLIQNFARSYLGIGWRDLPQIWYVDLPSLGPSLQQIWLNSGKCFQSYIGEKITFFVFLSIYSRCDTMASWQPHDTLPCILHIFGKLAEFNNLHIRWSSGNSRSDIQEGQAWMLLYE